MQRESCVAKWQPSLPPNQTIRQYLFGLTCSLYVQGDDGSCREAAVLPNGLLAPQPVMPNHIPISDVNNTTSDRDT